MDSQLNFYQYLSDISILVVKPDGKLTRLFCPFMVYPKAQNGSAKDSQPQIVSRIVKNDDGSIYFVVDNKAEPHHQYYIAFT